LLTDRSQNFLCAHGSLDHARRVAVYTPRILLSGVEQQEL
jgi:hypothetical protein